MHALPHSADNPDEDAAVLILNLMPLSVSATRLDKIVGGLYSRDLLRRFKLVVSSAQYQIYFCDLKLSKKRVRCKRRGDGDVGVDIRCYGATFPADSERTNFQISREPFRLMLNTEESAVYRSLNMRRTVLLGTLLYQILMCGHTMILLSIFGGTNMGVSASTICR